MTSATAQPLIPAPRWIEPTLQPNEGRDPLGLQTTTQDRLMPLLLPGILELSRRARYFSFYAFLLDEYRRRKMPANTTALSSYMKRREWDLGLAVLHCPDCDSSPVGAQRLRREIKNGDGPFPRGESVESPLGGYGLYYRSPLAELGIVARSGTMLGDQAITVDVLYDTPRAAALVETFREAVADTDYYKSWTSIGDDLSRDVIDEYAAVACLCRLPQLPEERAAVHGALFGTDATPPTTDAAPADAEGDEADVQTPALGNTGVTQRRRSVAHYLTLIADKPIVTSSQTAYRQQLWEPATIRGPEHELIAGQWAALVAKDVWQDALCSVWSQWCSAGLERTRELGRGLEWQEARDLARSLTTGPPELDPAEPTNELAARVVDGDVVVALDGKTIAVSAASVEQLRRACVGMDTASSGLVTVLELARRVADKDSHGWRQGAGVGSAWQPPLSRVLDELRLHLELADPPSVGDTLWWLVGRFILPVHERIGYSKLPEFTFRFRWEDGLLVFRDHGVQRFPLAAIRFWPLASITEDLGLWARPEKGTPQLTAIGAGLVDEVFA